MAGKLSTTQAFQQNSKKRRLPKWIKVVISILVTAPVALLFLYSTGAWDFALDRNSISATIDSSVSAGCIFCGIGALLLIHFSFRYYEDD